MNLQAGAVILEENSRVEASLCISREKVWGWQMIGHALCRPCHSNLSTPIPGSWTAYNSHRCLDFQILVIFVSTSMSNDGNNDTTDYFTPCAIAWDKNLFFFNPGLPHVAGSNLGVVAYMSRHHSYIPCTLIVNCCE